MEKVSTLGGRIIDAVRDTHWHVILTHFPISLFIASGGFMIAHLFTLSECYDRSAFIMLTAGVITMLPVTLSGWLTWKMGRYRGMRGKIFRYKARIAFGMLALGIALVAWHLISPDQPKTIWHYLYGIANTALLLGAIIEGYYGGKLTHGKSRSPARVTSEPAHEESPQAAKLPEVIVADVQVSQTVCQGDTATEESQKPIPVEWFS